MICLASIADASMKLYFEPLASIWLDPMAVDSLVLVVGPVILELVQFKALISQACYVSADAPSIPGLFILKAVPNRVGNY